MWCQLRLYKLNALACHYLCRWRALRNCTLERHRMCGERILQEPQGPIMSFLSRSPNTPFGGELKSNGMRNIRWLKWIKILVTKKMYRNTTIFIFAHIWKRNNGRHSRLTRKQKTTNFGQSKKILKSRMFSLPKSKYNFQLEPFDKVSRN